MTRPGPSPALHSAIGIDLLMLSVTLVWGMNFSIMKGVYAHFHPLALTALRFAAAVAILTPVLYCRRIGLKIEWRDWAPIVGLGFLSNTVYQVLFVQGLALTRAGNAGLLMASTPIFAYAIGLLLKREPFSGQVLAGILLSAGGVSTIVLAGGRKITLGADWRGDLLVLGAALCWGWYTATAARLVVKYGSLAVTYWLLVTGTVLLLPVVLPFVIRQEWSGIPPLAWAGFAYSALLSIVYCYLVWSYAIGRVGVSRTAVYSNVTPLIALLGGWFVLGEQPLAAQFMGACLILAGVLMVRNSARPAASIR